MEDWLCEWWGKDKQGFGFGVYWGLSALRFAGYVSRASARLVFAFQLAEDQAFTKD